MARLRSIASDQAGRRHVRKSDEREQHPLNGRVTVRRNAYGAFDELVVYDENGKMRGALRDDARQLPVVRGSVDEAVLQRPAGLLVELEPRDRKSDVFRDLA
jgi:hypothetical protein